MSTQETSIKRRYIGVSEKDNNAYLFLTSSLPNKTKFSLAHSADGISFQEFKKNPTIISESGEYEDPSKCSNFRVSKIDEWYYVTYKYKNGKIQSICTAASRDLIKWTKIGEIPNIAETGMVVPNFMHNKQYCMYYGETNISIATSQDLATWATQTIPVLSPRPKFFDDTNLEIGGVFKTSEGILVLYYVLKDKRYLIGAAILDAHEPTTVLWRSDEPLWEQTKDWKKTTVQPVGIIQFNDSLYSYWSFGKDGIFAINFNLKRQVKITNQGLHPTLDKHHKNPIITSRVHLPWEAQATMNPAAVYDKGKIHLAYRAIGDSGLSVVGYASSSDGIHFDERPDKPMYVPRETFEWSGGTTVDSMEKYMSGGGYGGCEDPRLTQIDGNFYLMYVAYDGMNPPRVALSSIPEDDFHNKNWGAWKKPVIISKPGIVDKNACLLPEKINGKYVIFHRIFPYILIDFVDSMDFDGTQYLQGEHRIAPTDFGWDSRKVGAGPPPMKTDDGWLLIYHAVDDKDDSQYKMGAMLLDPNDPTNVLYRTQKPILTPTEWYENHGFKAGVAYPCGAVIKDGTLFVYYGGADSYVCVATANLDEFLYHLKNQEEIKLQPISITANYI
jgi:predicted GH43/DUF377 family glycosyl hydrolase